MFTCATLFSQMNLGGLIHSIQWLMGRSGPVQFKPDFTRDSLGVWLPSAKFPWKEKALKAQCIPVMSSQTMQTAWPFNWESQPTAHAQQQKQNSQRTNAGTYRRHARSVFLFSDWVFPSHERLAGSGPSMLAFVCLQVNSSCNISFTWTPIAHPKHLLMVPIKNLAPLLNPNRPINH